MVAAWIIWPSPAIALVGALLLPAAIKVGLAADRRGHGDQHVRLRLRAHHRLHHPGAPGISAKAAGIDVADVMVSVPMMIVWAVIALPLAYRTIRKEILADGLQPIEWDHSKSPPRRRPKRKW